MEQVNKAVSRLCRERNANQQRCFGGNCSGNGQVEQRFLEFRELSGVGSMRGRQW